MKRRAIFALVALPLLAIGGNSAVGQGFNIKFAHPAPPDDAAHKAALMFKEKLEQRTGGKIKVNVFPGGQLGQQPQVIQGLQSGAIEMSFFSSTWLVNFVPAFGVLDLPYLANKKEHVGLLLEGQIGNELLAKLPAIGIKGLAYSESSFRNVFTKRPVDSLEGLKGLKLRVPNSPVYVATMRAMGALPTPIAFGELYSAIQQGIVDGAETAGSSYWSYKFYEVGPNWVITNHTILPGVYLMSGRFWDRLPKDLQQIVQDTASEAARFHRNQSWSEDDEGVKLAQQKGVKVHVIGDLSPVIKKARDLYPELAVKIGPEIVDRAVALLK